MLAAEEVSNKAAAEAEEKALYPNGKPLAAAAASKTAEEGTEEEAAAVGREGGRAELR